MELIKNTAPVVTFTHPGADTVISNVKITSGDGTTYLDIETEGNQTIAQLPYLDKEESFVVIWEFVFNNRVSRHTDYFEVITPYLNDSEMKAIFEDGTDAQRRDVESAVRTVINSYCNQSFGYSEETHVVSGQGEDALRLPQRLLKLNSLETTTAVLSPNGVIISGGGWYLKKKWLEEIAQKRTDDRYWGDDRPGGIITAPGYSSRPTTWSKDYPFLISGEWGWRFVPQDIKEAAKLLVNDYACMEIAYRDRYLESIKAADWRLQYSQEAWQRTGNVRADQLLSDYVVLDWAAI